MYFNTYNIFTIENTFLAHVSLEHSWQVFSLPVYTIIRVNVHFLSSADHLRPFKRFSQLHVVLEPITKLDIHIKVER